MIHFHAACSLSHQKSLRNVLLSVVIPKEVRPYLPNHPKELRRSLKTSNRSLALRRARFLWVEFQHYLSTVKHSNVTKYFISPHNMPPMAEEDAIKHLIMQEKWLKLSRAGLTGEHLPKQTDYDAIERAYQDLIKALEANKEAMESVSKQVESERQDFLFKKFSGQIPAQTTMGQQVPVAPYQYLTSPNTITEKSCTTLSKVIEEFIEVRKLKNKWKRQKTEQETTAVLALWLRILGDRPMHELATMK